MSRRRCGADPHVAAGERGDDEQQQQPPGVREHALSPPRRQVAAAWSPAPTSRACGRRRSARRRRPSRGRCAAAGDRARAAQRRRHPVAVGGGLRGERRRSRGGLHLRVRPVSGSASTTVPTSGSSSSRGSTTSMASRSSRGDSARRGALPVDLAEEVGDHDDRPRRRGGRRSASSAAARSPRVPSGARGVRAICRSSPRACIRPPRAGGDRTVCRRWRPRRRSGCRRRGQVRDRRERGDGEVALLADGRCRSPGSARGRPRARSPARGRRSSARTCGCVVRAVTGQSIRRTSSPGW